MAINAHSLCINGQVFFRGQYPSIKTVIANLLILLINYHFATHRLSSTSECVALSGRRVGKWSTETMPELVVGNTEPDGSKLKKWKGFFKPNFDPLMSSLPRWSASANPEPYAFITQRTRRLLACSWSRRPDLGPQGQGAAISLS
jgi:hypothetical protein